MVISLTFLNKRFYAEILSQITFISYQQSPKQSSSLILDLPANCLRMGMSKVEWVQAVISRLKGYSWSLDATRFVLLVGHFLYDALNRSPIEVFKQTIPPRDALKILAMDRERRINATEALQDNWFKPVEGVEEDVQAEEILDGRGVNICGENFGKMSDNNFLRRKSCDEFLLHLPNQRKHVTESRRFISFIKNRSSFKATKV
jgi:hypothetical protein